MSRRGRLRSLDDRLLGSNVIALIAGFVSLYFLFSWVAAVADRAWISALVYLVLGAACGQAALREWRRRTR